MASRVPPRRRNGKYQACEPCRKAKVSCDHTLPVCDRCRRRDIVARCIYVDAPMAKMHGVGVQSAESRGSSSKTTAEAIRSPSTQTVSPIERKSEPASQNLFSGYFGPTAFSSIFDENKDKLGDGIQISRDAETYAPQNEALQSHTLFMLAGGEVRDAQRVCLGVSVLRTLPDQTTCKFLLDWYFRLFNKCLLHKPSIMEFANSLWGIYGKQLKEPRRLKNLEEISQALCRNAEKPVGDDVEDYESWIRLFSGENLRWESLGCVLAAIISAILSLPDGDAFFCTQKGQRANRKLFALELKDCVQACIILSSYMDNLNVQMVALLAKNLVMTTVLSGDTSLQVWRQLGDLVCATTALGLHRDMHMDRPVTFVSELKRRVFTVVFFIDKGSSLLTGRPPALSYRYCKFKMPLDISEEDSMNEEDLKRAVHKLDAHGWSTGGKVLQSTTNRTSSMLGIVLDEILEVSLGDFGSCTDRIIPLSNRLEQTYASFPECIRWSPESLHTEVDDESFFKRVTLRLQTLELKLLLDRMAYKYNLQNGQVMVDCAREMLELLVTLWVQRDRFIVHHHDYDWMLMAWGVPSAGVLCVELLKQMKAPPGTYPMHIPRSCIVQNLALLIGFLEWIRPSAGNYKLCGTMRVVIKRILDQILNQPPSSVPSTQQSEGPLPQQQQQQQQQQEVGEGFDGGLGLDSGDFGFEGLDELDWLDGIDWSKGPWIDFGGQDYSAARWS